MIGEARMTHYPAILDLHNKLRKKGVKQRM